MPQIDLTLIGLPNFFSKNRVTDEEAITLYKLWASSPPGQDIMADGTSVRGLVSKGLLKPKGMQEGTASKFSLTSEGRIILVEMVTNIGNTLKPDNELPKLSKIRSRAKRARQTFVKKAGLEETNPVIVKVEGFDVP